MENVAASATMARMDPEWVPRPHAAHIILTYKCNLKCGGCPSWEVRDHNDLSAEEYRNLFRQLTSLDLVKVLGGEPFVRRDIVEILSDVRDIIDPYVMQLTTNGMLTKRTIEALHKVAWPGLQLRISVDGLEKTHDRMRGVEGSWATVTRTVREVAELKAKYGFKFGINFAVTDESLHEMDDMIAFAESVGADLIPGVNVSPFLVGTRPPEEEQQRIIMLERRDEALEAMTRAEVGARGPTARSRSPPRPLVHEEHVQAAPYGRSPPLPPESLGPPLPATEWRRCALRHGSQAGRKRSRAVLR